MRWLRQSWAGLVTLYIARVLFENIQFVTLELADFTSASVKSKWGQTETHSTHTPQDSSKRQQVETGDDGFR